MKNEYLKRLKIITSVCVFISAISTLFFKTLIGELRRTKGLFLAVFKDVKLFFKLLLQARLVFNVDINI